MKRNSGANDGLAARLGHARFAHIESRLPHAVIANYYVNSPV